MERPTATLGLTLVCTAVVAAATWRLSGANAAFAIIAAGTAFTAWSLGWSLRVASIAVALCIVPPGVIGENSASISVAAALLLYLLIVTVPVETSLSGTVVQLSALLLVAEALAFLLGTALAGYPAFRTSASLLALYTLIGASVYEAARRPRLLIHAIRCLTWLVALACASYAISYAAGFAGGTTLHLKYRTIEFAPPLTVTQPSGGYLPGFPRLLVFGGEPGLGGIFVLVAMWGALRFERARQRLGLLVVLGAGVLFTQSTGLVFALVAFALGFALVNVTKRLTLAITFVLALGLIPLLESLIGFLIRVKQTANPSSLADRGFGVTGFHGGQTTGDISLVATLAHHAWLAAPLLVLLAWLGLCAIRDPLSLGLVLGLGSIALYAQPLQWHPGVWFLLIVGVALGLRLGDARAPRPATLGVY
jgi:hypothetical protein